MDKLLLPVFTALPVRPLNPLLTPMAREELTEVRPTCGRLPEEVEVPVLELPPEDVK